MIINVYIETNFLLNIAKKQEESFYSSKILRLAKNKKIILILPIYCIPESYSALFRKHELFRKLKRRAITVLDDINRSRLHKPIYEVYKNLPTEIAVIIQREVNRLDKVITEVWKSAKILNSSSEIHKKGIVFRTTLDLQHEMDAAIFSTIENDLKTTKSSAEKIFLTADEKMLTPELIKLLSQRNCTCFHSFMKAYKFIENRIGQHA